MPEEAWSDLEEVVTHFERFFPDGGLALQQELPVLIKSIQVKLENLINRKKSREMQAVLIFLFQTLVFPYWH